MLILTRKAKEQIYIGEDIQVTVLGIRGNRVRIGIKAPGDVSVLRSELLPWTNSENRENPPLPDCSASN